MITKQEVIENTIDKLDTGMTAMLALVSRQVRADWKTNDFIKSFTNSMGLYFDNDLLYKDIACRIVNYLYPENRAYWNIWDNKYKDDYNNSCLPGLIKYNKKGGF
jgi:hypothetical protein